MKVFSDTKFKTVTGYVELPAERHEFHLQPAGQTQTKPLATSNEGLAAGARYTIVAEEQKPNTFKFDVLKDDLTPPAADKAKVRIINATVAMEKLSAVYQGGELFSGIESGSATSFKEIAPVTGAIEIRRNSKNPDILRVPDYAFEAGKLYTLVITGGAGQPIQMIPVIDRMIPPRGD